MAERKETPTGILIFIAFIIVLDVLFFVFLSNSLISGERDFSEFLSISIPSMILWLDVLLALLSVIVIPYGFMKRKNLARIFTMCLLVYSIFRVLVYTSMTGEKNIGFLLFCLFAVSLMYLLMTPVRRYFGLISMAIVPCEIKTEFTYGLYTLYSDCVRLKNGKNQVIYFFSKRIPKSGTPSLFPDGFEVEISSRSGLPYLKKRQDSSIRE